ncbi:MAG TPA: sensor histidine kinase [Xanthobacteraceae bacterium]|nr:sensor histidine kinase [Xanthobacteraceae bacterium]HVY19865.1 sensor histidine kinase [Bauldia sp.]
MLIEIRGPDERPPDFDGVAEANHRIANHLAILAGLVRLQSQRLTHRTEPLDPADAAMSLADIGARLETIAELHKALARLPRDEAVVLDSYLRDVVTNVVNSLSGAAETKLELNVEATCRLGSKRTLNIALIACEVITNSVKYAHPAGVSGRLAVTCRCTGPDLILEIEDDGVGLPEGVDPRTSGNVGFRVIRALAADLGAQISFQSDELGVTFRLVMPKAGIAAPAQNNGAAAFRSG